MEARPPVFRNNAFTKSYVILKSVRAEWHIYMETVRSQFAVRGELLVEHLCFMRGTQENAELFATFTGPEICLIK